VTAEARYDFSEELVQAVPEIDEAQPFLNDFYSAEAGELSRADCTDAR
jgi:hypothetical protein